MEFTFSFVLLAYCTWWILLLVALLIIIFKLVIQKHFQVAINVGITSSGYQGEADTYTFHPLLVKCRKCANLNKKDLWDKPNNNQVEGTQKVASEWSFNWKNVFSQKILSHIMHSVMVTIKNQLTVKLGNNLAKTKTKYWPPRIKSKFVMLQVTRKVFSLKLPPGGSIGAASAGLARW